MLAIASDEVTPLKPQKSPFYSNFPILNEFSIIFINFHPVMVKIGLPILAKFFDPHFWNQVAQTPSCFSSRCHVCNGVSNLRGPSRRVEAGFSRVVTRGVVFKNSCQKSVLASPRSHLAPVFRARFCASADYTHFPKSAEKLKGLFSYFVILTI